MSRPAPRGALRVGDRIRADGVIQTVAGLEGTSVRLVDPVGTTQVVLLSYLLGCEDFEMLDTSATPARLPPLALLDTLPEAVVTEAWLRDPQ